jgi:2-polyprenyl-6-methoxyphenol hydroxylase-like FAD-dependent oxidoreductase
MDASRGNRPGSCIIAGGGPAGMMLGFLLARAGIDTTVLEKHGDFLRDFRGDTIHPSTLNLMNGLGLLDAFLARPHDELTHLSASINGEKLPIADFSHVPAARKCLVLMPQWDFLNFLAERGKGYPTLHVRMNAEAIDLLYDAERVTGVRVREANGESDLRANVVVAADGRHSTLRAKADLRVDELGAPMDVLWLRLSRKPGDDGQAFGFVSEGSMLVAIDRTTYWQCAFVIAKGSYDAVRAAGLPAFRDRVASTAPFLHDRVSEITSWDDVKLLTVAVDRLQTWYRDGLLCIGDAAHAMSPIGGVGINLAIQDAVAAANELAAPLARGRVDVAHLRAVQRRRTFPTKATQRIQIVVQNNVITGVLSDEPVKAPAVLRLLSAVPLLQRIPAFLVGIGFRPERVRTPDAFAATPSATAR